MYLREYLYVDIDKVSGILSQVADGTPELATTVERREKTAEARNNLFGGFGGRTVGEDSTQKNMGDALFKILEDELTALQILRDVSFDLADDRLSVELLEPGTLVRVTAPATLFHSGQLSEALVGIATAASGIAKLTAFTITPSETQRPRKQAPKTKSIDRRTGGPEDELLTLPEEIPFIGVNRDVFAGFIQAVRGIFSNGVHLHLRPRGMDGPIITARLEDGRRFLDATPEVLFSRFGIDEQEWTLVGTIGQVGRLAGDEMTEIADVDGNLNRAALVKLVGDFLGTAGSMGFVDLPTPPGFSVVPLAVYRLIGRKAPMGQYTDDRTAKSHDQHTV